MRLRTLQNILSHLCQCSSAVGVMASMLAHADSSAANRTQLRSGYREEIVKLLGILESRVQETLKNLVKNSTESVANASAKKKR